MSVLDELRNEIQEAIDRCPPNPNDFERGVNGGLRSARVYINEFEAAHPGLIDKTLNCANCGLPMPIYWEDGSGGPLGNPGWNYVWTFGGPKWLEPFEVDDEVLHDIWLCCPACVKEATP